MARVPSPYFPCFILLHFFFCIFCLFFRRFYEAQVATFCGCKAHTSLAQWTAKMLHVAGGGSPPRTLLPPPSSPTCAPLSPFFLFFFLTLLFSFFGAAAIHKRGRLILVPRGPILPSFWASTRVSSGFWLLLGFGFGTKARQMARGIAIELQVMIVVGVAKKKQKNKNNKNK